MENLVIDGVALTSIIGVIAFIVSAIVEVTKKLKPFSLMPTQLWCVIVSVVVCVAGYFGYCTYTGIEAVWYLVGDAVIVAFIVAYIAMYGWDTAKELYDRFTGKTTAEKKGE